MPCIFRIVSPIATSPSCKICSLPFQPLGLHVFSQFSQPDFRGLPQTLHFYPVSAKRFAFISTKKQNEKHIFFFYYKQSPLKNQAIFSPSCVFSTCHKNRMHSLGKKISPPALRNVFLSFSAGSSRPGRYFAQNTPRFSAGHIVVFPLFPPKITQNIHDFTGALCKSST